MLHRVVSPQGAVGVERRLLLARAEKAPRVAHQSSFEGLPRVPCFTGSCLHDEFMIAGAFFNDLVLKYRE